MNDRLPRPTTILLLVAIVCPGCLIFNPTDFPDPKNEPPLILWTDPPTSDVQFVDRTANATLELEMAVYDGNEEDELSARGAFVDPAIDPVSRFGTATVTREADDPRERLVVLGELAPAILSRGCHVIELDVADTTTWVGNQVSPPAFKVSATWLFVVHEGDGFDDISLASCPGADPGQQDGTEQ